MNNAKLTDQKAPRHVDGPTVGYFKNNWHNEGVMVPANITISVSHSS